MDSWTNIITPSAKHCSISIHISIPLFILNTQGVNRITWLLHSECISCGMHYFHTYWLSMPHLILAVFFTAIFRFLFKLACLCNKDFLHVRASMMCCETEGLCHYVYVNSQHAKKPENALDVQVTFQAWMFLQPGFPLCVSRILRFLTEKILLDKHPP